MTIHDKHRVSSRNEHDNMRAFGHEAVFYIVDAEVCHADNEIGRVTHRIKVSSASFGITNFAEKMNKEIARVEAADDGNYTWVSLRNKRGY